MAMLEITPIPLHRSIYPGELHLWLGGGREKDDALWVPGGWGARVLHYNEEHPPVVAAQSGPFELYAKNGEPVMIASPDAPADELDGLRWLSGFTGVALGAELLCYLKVLLDGFDGNEGFAAANYRFRDLAQYNDLMISLAIKAGAPIERSTRTHVLGMLLDDVNRNAGLQAAWYHANGPAKPGETEAGYEAEVAAFVALTQAYTAATAAQMAA